MNGDANTKYLHAVASSLKNHNVIWSLQDEIGAWVSDDPSIKTLGARHFRNIFEDDHLTSIATQLKVIQLFPSFIDPEEKEAFMSAVTISKVERAL